MQCGTGLFELLGAPLIRQLDQEIIFGSPTRQRRMLSRGRSTAVRAEQVSRRSRRPRPNIRHMQNPGACFLRERSQDTEGSHGCFGRTRVLVRCEASIQATRAPACVAKHKQLNIGGTVIAATAVVAPIQAVWRLIASMTSNLYPKVAGSNPAFGWETATRARRACLVLPVAVIVGRAVARISMGTVAGSQAAG